MSSCDFVAARRILIVKPSSLGDIVHTLPLVALIRHQAPGAELRWLVNEVWAPLLHGHPLLDGVIEFPRQALRGMRAPLGFVDWVRRQSDWRPDLAIDVQGLLRSLLLARAFRPRHLIGYSDAREGARFGFDSVVDTRRARSPHAVDRYLSLADAFGWDVPQPLPFPLPPGVAPPGAETLPPRFVLLHPFSRGRGKSLEVGQVVDLCRRLRGIPVVLAGRAEVPVPQAPEICNWLNRTSLPELIWLLRRAAFTVSVDSGPMHLAAAVSPRVLSLHTWSDPVKVGPYPDEAFAWKAGAIRTMREWRALGADLGDGRGRGEFPDAAIPGVAEFVRGCLVDGDPVR